MRIAYIDPFCGAAGDMLLGACVDAGLSVKSLEKELKGLGLKGWKLRSRAVMKGAIGATKVDVVIGKGRGAATEFEHHHAHGHEHGSHHEDHAHAQRRGPSMSLTRILQLLERAKLSMNVRRKAKLAFLRLAHAEARVHRKSVDTVHFHEVGAIDSIVDMAGGILALEMLGVERVVAAPFPVSHGHIHCAHGTLPVPGPATLEIIKGAPTTPLDVNGETLTPTAAALIRELAREFGPQPEMIVSAVGYGAGDRDFPERPNVLRLVIGESVEAGNSDEVWVLETNVDNVTPEVMAFALERCLLAGAVDAFASPIQMKKGRPATLLTALVPRDSLSEVQDSLFAETGTLGIRRHLVSRTKLARLMVSVRTKFGPIRLKVGGRDGAALSVSPEFEDCRRAADRDGVPVRTVMAEAVRTYQKTNEASGSGKHPAFPVDPGPAYRSWMRRKS